MKKVRMIFRVLLTLLVFSVPVRAEEFAVSGKVVEKGTRKPLMGITVFLPDHGEANAETDAEGNFSIHVEGLGEYPAVAAGVGYLKSDPKTLSVPPSGLPVVIYLEPAQQLADVVVKAERNKDKTAKTVITGKELAKVPGTAGDPLRGIQALPGITTSSDTSGNPAIRGSGPQDNAYYVDFLPVGYLFHLGGLVSTVSADLVDDFNLYSAAFGPEFADVTGGVIDVSLRAPRKDRIGVKLNVGMLEADALVEGPIDAKRSFYVSARRSYIDLFMPKGGSVGGGDAKIVEFPYYYDYSAKYLWEMSDVHKLSIQAGGAFDAVKISFPADSDVAKREPVLAGDLGFEMGYNSVGGVLSSRLGEEANNRLGAVVLMTSNHTNISQAGYTDAKVVNTFVRDQLVWRATSAHEALFEAEAGMTDIRLDLNIPNVVPNDFNPPPGDITGTPRTQLRDAIKSSYFALGAKDRWRLSERVTLAPGLRQTYGDYLKRSTLEPRLSLEYRHSEETLITAGWGRYHQFPDGPQMVRNFGNPSLDYFKADHYVLGVERKYGHGWSAKAETYYKRLFDLVTPHQPEIYLNGGSGKAYGFELLFKKDRTDDWSGWLSVGYSRSERRNDFTGQAFAFKNDQPLIINAVYSRKLGERWNFGAKWRYQSGAPITPVVGTLPAPDGSGRLVPVYGPLGSERLPDYHRLDVRFDREYLYDTWKMSFYIEFINAYFRQNVSGYQYNADYSQRKPVSQLPFFPSFGVLAEF